MNRVALAAALAVMIVLGAWVAAPARVAGAQTAGLRLEPLGDSITYGTQSSTGNGYRQNLRNELTGEGYVLDFVGSVRAGAMADADNEGHRGLRIDQIAALTDSSLATYKPNVVTLMAGTNDMVQAFQESTAPARISALVDRIVADDPSATVLVANLIVGTRARLAAGAPAFNATIPAMVQSKQAAGKHVEFVNTSALTASDLAFDGIHPLDSGYQKIADAFDAGIRAAAAAGWLTTPGSNRGSPAAGITGSNTPASAGSVSTSAPATPPTGRPSRSGRAVTARHRSGAWRIGRRAATRHATERRRIHHTQNAPISAAATM